jgi:hypothetical protein
MDKKDIFFDTNIIKLRGEWFDTCYITAAYDVEVGELVYDSGAIAAFSVFGVALEKARMNEPCLVIYKADRIMLPYYTNTDEETDILNDYYLVNEIGNPQPISGKRFVLDWNSGVTYVTPAAVYLSWANQEYGHAILLEMPEHSPYSLPNGDGNWTPNLNPKYGLFELLGGIRKRKYTHRPFNPRVT